MSNSMKGMIAGLVATIVLSGLLLLKGSMDIAPHLSVITLLSQLGSISVVQAWMDHFIDYLTTKHYMAEALRAVIASGGNPFAELSLPEAIIRFKQGFGRLIRSKTDTGIVVVLDKRIVTKGYGKQFLAALPGCKVLRVRV